MLDVVVGADVVAAGGQGVVAVAVAVAGVGVEL